VKRAMDVAGAGIMLLALVPLLASLMVAVRITSPGPAMYWSSRVGRRGRLFNMPKLRSMRVGTPAVATDRLVDPTSALTPIGGFLRKWSLDEIPQLWSVLVGDMSLVGPRPALFNQTELIVARRRLGIDALRPGITGLAQVSGRDSIPEQRKVELDAQYLARQSLALDISILLATFAHVLRRDGISH
jgi:O-antigen biosynthesis protein WbqP